MRELCSAGRRRTAARNFFDAKEIPIEVLCNTNWFHTAESFYTSLQSLTRSRNEPVHVGPPTLPLFPWLRPQPQVHPIPHLPSVSLWRTFKWFSLLQAGEPSGNFPSRCRTNIFHASFTFPYAVKHFYTSFFSTVLIMLSGEMYKSWSSSLCNFLHPHFSSSP